MNLEKKLNKLHSEKYGQARRFGNEDWIINLSDVLLPPKVVDMVSLGPKLNVKSNILYKNDIVDTIKNVESKLGIIDIDNNVKNDIRAVITKNIRQNLKNKVDLSHTEKIFEENVKITKLVLKNQKEKDKVFFTKVDKGNVTVCINQKCHCY